MDRGPVLSRVLDLVTEGASPQESHFWENHLQPFGDHEIKMIADPSNGELQKQKKNCWILFMRNLED